MYMYQRMMIALALSLPVSAFSQCPVFSNTAANSACGSVITINAGGTITVTNPGGPYDGSDDTLVGVINNSSLNVSSINLSSNTDIFGFDGDGIDTYGAPSNSRDTSGYGGPDAYFTNFDIAPTYTNDVGTVNFINPIVSNGGTGYFSLEEALNTASLSGTIGTTSPGTGSGVTPEPSSLVLLATGLLGAAGVARRRFFAR